MEEPADYFDPNFKPPEAEAPTFRTPQVSLEVSRPILRATNDVPLLPVEDSLWGTLGISIAMAGGFYPVVLVLLLLPFATIGTLMSSGSGAVMIVIIAAPVTAAMGFGIGFAIAGVVSLFALVVVYLALRALSIRLPWGELGAFTGGLIAYLCTLPVTLTLLVESIPGVPYLLFLLLGPVLAIFIGQIGGAVAGVANHRIAVRKHGANYCQSRWRFSLWQLMALMVVVSVLLTVLRATQLLSYPFFIATVAWLLLQMVGRRPAILLAKGFELRRLRKKHAERQQWRKEHGCRYPHTSRRMAAVLSKVPRDPPVGRTHSEQQ